MEVIVIGGMGNRPKELTLTHTTKPPYAFDRRAAVATNFDVAVGMKIMAAAEQREALGDGREALNYLLSLHPLRHCVHESTDMR